jgi:hypothetical protein
MGIAPLISSSKLDEMYGEPKHIPGTPKIKEMCLRCASWTGYGIRGPGKAYKCYCGSCPAKARDETGKQGQLRGRNKRR